MTVSVLGGVEAGWSELAIGPSVHLFGTIAVTVAGRPTVLPRGKPATLLAVLALQPGRAVDADAIVDALWDERPPASARALIHTYVSTLRHFLAAEADPLHVETVAGGYRLVIQPADVDVHRLLQLAADADASTEALQDGLAVAAEPLLVGMAGSLFTAWRLRVKSAREAVQLRHWARRVSTGDVFAVLPELQFAVDEQPLREDAVLLLAEALSTSGRREEALAVLDGYRLRLGTDLGLDPSPRVAAARGRMLVPTSSSVSRPTGHATVRSAPPAPEPPAHAAESLLRRRGVAAVLGVVAALLITTMVIGATRRTGAGRDDIGAPAAGPAAVVLDPMSGEVSGWFSLPVRPSGIELSGDTGWVRSEVDRGVAVLDLVDARVDRVLGLPQPPTALAGTGRSVTVGLGYDGTVVEVTRELVGPPRQAVTGSSGRLTLAADGATVWAATMAGSIHSLAGERETAPRLSTGGAPRRMAVDDTRVWVVTSNRKELVALGIDDATRVVSPLRGDPVDLDVAGGDAWVVTSGDNRLWRASALDGRVVSTRVLPGPPAGVIAAPDRVWVAVREPAGLASYDRTTLQPVSTVHLARTPVDLALASGRLVVVLR